METSPNAPRQGQPRGGWRRRTTSPTRGSRRSAGRWAARCSALYEQARLDKTEAQRRGLLDAFAAATENWTRSALVAAAAETAPQVYVTDALRYGKPQALADFVGGILPSALPAHAGPLLVAAAGAGPGAAPLKATIVRAVARMQGGTLAMDAATSAALQTLIDDAATSAAVLPIVARWDKAGALRASADRRAAGLVAELGGAGGHRRSPRGHCRQPAWRARAPAGDRWPRWRRC